MRLSTLLASALGPLLVLAVCPLARNDNDLDRESQLYPLEDGSPHWMTTDAGVPIDDQHSLKAGDRGPTLLEDCRLRRKLQHFDHERVMMDCSRRRRSTVH